MHLTHFKENNTVFVASEKIWTFKQKLEFWNTCIHHCKLDSFSVVTDFLITKLYYKVMYGYKIHSEYKIEQWILMLTEYTNSDCTLQTTFKKLHQRRIATVI